MKGAWRPRAWRRAVAAAAVLGAALVAASGCGTARPMPNERMGFLERVAAADHSRQSNRFGSMMRGPAAREVRGPRHTRATAADRGAIEVVGASFRWPLARNEITSPFGSRGRDFHEGIDLKARTGTPVFAAQDGMVIYAGGKIKGYGRMVVIRHFKELATIYAHNSRLLVRKGQFVRQGQRIAITGNTGHSSGPHLHFEIRDGLAALNPLEILPSVHAVEPQVVRTAQAAPAKPAEVVEVSKVARPPAPAPAKAHKKPRWSARTKASRASRKMASRPAPNRKPAARWIARSESDADALPTAPMERRRR